MTDLQDFRDKMSNYKSYWEQNPGKTYLDWKKAIQELKHIDIDNDPTYDYKGYCDLNNFAAQDMLNKKNDAHFTDNFKTSWHPTFSEESGYSGYINKFNPNGITGGSWGDHSYNLSDSQMANDWDIKNTLDYLSIAENEGISLKYDDKYPVIDDTVIGGVLPEVEVKGYKDSGIQESPKYISLYNLNKFANQEQPTVINVSKVKDASGKIFDYSIIGNGVPRKSLIGNNGDFNLNSSNMYKSLFPIGIGLGATSLYNKKQGGKLIPKDSKGAVGKTLKYPQNNNKRQYE